MVDSWWCTVRSLGLHGIDRVCGQRRSATSPAGCPPSTSWVCPTPPCEEARERVRAAVKNCGATFPVSRITVNLAPAGQKKAGTVYDLPILVGLLAAGRAAAAAGPAQRRFIGELSLTGALRGVHRRCCPWPWQPGDAGVQDAVCPGGERRRGHAGRRADRLPVYRMCGQLVRHLRGEERLSPAPAWEPEAEAGRRPGLCRDVMGQEQVPSGPWRSPRQAATTCC